MGRDDSGLALVEDRNAAVTRGECMYSPSQSVLHAIKVLCKDLGGS
jgi:hypothetical protein